MSEKSLSEMPITEQMKARLGEERHAVERLGEQIGYGNMMSLASEIWGIDLQIKGMPGAQFAVGPCAHFVQPCGCESPKDCDWCCGCGWLTGHVREIKETMG